MSLSNREVTGPNLMRHQTNKGCLKSDECTSFSGYTLDVVGPLSEYLVIPQFIGNEKDETEPPNGVFSCDGSFAQPACSGTQDVDAGFVSLSE
jgi:hypothetical protein